MRRPDPLAAAPFVLGRVSRHFAVPTGSVVALEDVDVEGAAAELTVITGPSGSGKSTLLRLIACLDRASSGTVRVTGTDVGQASRAVRRRLRRTMLGIIIAAPAENLFEHLDAAGNLEAARRLRGRTATGGVALAEVGLEGRDRARVPELSGGEQLRLAVAVALAGRPQLVVADEPTAALDARSGADIAALLRRVVDAGTTVAVASHDPAIIDLGDRVIRLEHGRVA